MSVERDTLKRSHPLSERLVGAVVWTEFIDRKGRTYRHRFVVYDYEAPYIRIRDSNGLWEKLTRTKVNRGMEPKLTGNITGA